MQNDVVRKVCLVYTGGTIGMKTNPETGALSPFDFNDIYDEFPYLRKLAVDINVYSFKPIDSSNVTPELWVQLARLIKDNYDEFDGFVILHGTDTMSYTASALSFMLENLDKPVVFTGSQIPIGVLRTDGRENLITAVEIAAAHRNGTAIVPEVSLYFQNRLFRANRTTKNSAEQLSAFSSDNYPALAEVGVNIHYNFNSIYVPRKKTDALHISTQFNPNVVIIKIFPGLTENIFRSMLQIDGLRGVVLETYGSGNAPTSEWFIGILEKAINKGIVVMNVTQCPGGSVSMELYETGIRLNKIGVISGNDITTEAAITKMMYLLGRETDHAELSKELKRQLRGEISV